MLSKWTNSSYWRALQTWQWNKDNPQMNWSPWLLTWWWPLQKVRLRKKYRYHRMTSTTWSQQPSSGILSVTTRPTWWTSSKWISSRQHSRQTWEESLLKKIRKIWQSRRCTGLPLLSKEKAKKIKNWPSQQDQKCGPVRWTRVWWIWHGSFRMSLNSTRRGKT